MNNDFAAAMRRALDHTRAGRLDQATTGIQAALAGSCDDGGDQLKDITPPASSRPPFSVIDPAADGPTPGHRPRRPLGDVVDALRQAGSKGFEARMPGMNRDPGMRPDIPNGAQYLHRSYGCSAGSRDYKLYVPSALPDGPRGLVVMLHGCTQSPDDFAAGTGMNEIAERHGLLIAYPGQTQADNAQACWNWFRPGDQLRDRGEPSIIAGLTRELIVEFAINPERVFVAGFSAGGAMAEVMAATYPDLFAAAGVHSGLPFGSARDVVSAFAAMRGETFAAATRPPRSDDGASVRRIVFHGGGDHTVHPSNARRVIAADHRGDVASETGGAAGARRYERTIWPAPDGRPEAELWLIEGAGHAWSGGRSGASYTDPKGPDASAEMVRFFLNLAQ